MVSCAANHASITSNRVITVCRRGIILYVPCFQGRCHFLDDGGTEFSIGWNVFWRLYSPLRVPAARVRDYKALTDVAILHYEYCQNMKLRIILYSVFITCFLCNVSWCQAQAPPRQQHLLSRAHSPQDRTTLRPSRALAHNTIQFTSLNRFRGVNCVPGLNLPWQRCQGWLGVPFYRRRTSTRISARLKRVGNIVHPFAFSAHT